MMTFQGVPILDLVLLVTLLGFGVEAYVTTRSSKKDPSEGVDSDPSSSSD